MFWSGLHISLVVYRYDWSNKSHAGTISPIICGRQRVILPCTQSISYMLLVSCLRRHVTYFSCTYDTWIRREDTGISVGYFVIFLSGCIVRPNQYQAEKRSLNMDTSDSDLSEQGCFCALSGIEACSLSTADYCDLYLYYQTVIFIALNAVDFVKFIFFACQAFCLVHECQCKLVSKFCQFWGTIVDLVFNLVA